MRRKKSRMKLGLFKISAKEIGYYLKKEYHVFGIVGVEEVEYFSVRIIRSKCL
jgi:hypothetical protein